uniref:Transport and golgi organization 6 homolog n=1 Tax=Catharus ustulatus TaxID=91951 RepID=A0A8C3UWF8_CATUS
MAGGAQAGPEPGRVVEALELLLGPPSDGDSAAEPGPEPALCPETLRRNAAALEERLSGAAGWAALRELRAAVLSRAPALAAGVAGTEPGWAAACGLLALLLCLRDRLAALAATSTATSAAPGAPPPPGADTLSVGQERAVRRALRAAVGLGLLPHLPPGLGPGPGLGPPPGTRGARLFAAVAALVELARLPALGAPLLARHLRLLLSGLCVLGHGPAALCQVRAALAALSPLPGGVWVSCRAPARSSGGPSRVLVAAPRVTQRTGGTERLQGTGTAASVPSQVFSMPWCVLFQGVSEAERAQCREALRDILDRVYQPLAVQELLVLQGQPKQSSAGARAAPAWLRRLCGHLLSERLLRPGGVQAVVRGVLEGTDGGAGAEAAALDWRKCDAVGKILAACPQQCLSLEDYYRQVCPQILDLLHIQDKVAARQFQRVATTTLLTMAREQPQLAEKHLLQPLLAPLRRCSEAAGTWTGEGSGFVYVVGNDSSSLLLGSLQSVLGVVFSLYSFAKQNVSYLRSPCQDILLWFLEKAEREQSLAVLEGLAGLSSHVPTLHPQCQLCVGSEGGAAVIVGESTSDEDEALYQKISLEQCHVESLVELLSHCQKSGLAGDFFIHCLKELTQVAAEDEAAPNPAVEPAGSLLELEQSQARQGRKLLVLQLVAALCQGVSDTVFTDIVQVQEFLAAVLHRACAHPAQGPGAAAEAQTLAMAMGLVAAVLGGAVQLKSSDFEVLKRLVPLLEELSRTYPDPLTQELASDLRIAICTHGACSPGTVGAAADSVLGRKPGMAAQSPAGPPGTAPSPPSPRHGHGHSPSAHSERSKGQSTCHEPSASGVSPAPCADSLAPAGLQELLLSAYDPQPPSRAAALRHLASLVTQRDPEALQLQEKLLQVFLENVQHEDAFVYLSAIQGIALLSSEYPERILPVLLAQYECPAQGTEDAMAAVTRMKLGEVLMRVTRALGESTPWAWHCPLPAATALLGLTITRGRAHRGLLLSEGGKGPKAEVKLGFARRGTG